MIVWLKVSFQKRGWILHGKQGLHLAQQTPVLYGTGPCVDVVQQQLQELSNAQIDCKWEYPFSVSIVHKRKQVIGENLEKAGETASKQLVSGKKMLFPKWNGIFTP